VDYGFTIEHLDLVERRITALPKYATLATAKGHGTAVLGIIGATARNGFGIAGIAFDATLLAVSMYQDPCNPDPAPRGALIAAGHALDAGDVLVLPIQDASNYPVEDKMVTREIICAIVAKGIVVVASAGNGPLLLQSDDGPAADLLRQASILIGACCQKRINGELVRTLESNYGPRVPCFALGENVLTTGDGYEDDSPPALGNFTKRPQFGETSAAAAIVGGVAAVIQSAARRRWGTFFSPSEMLSILKCPTLGTRCRYDSEIGVMPNLKKILTRIVAPATTKEALLAYTRRVERRPQAHAGVTRNGGA
jgi:hypothetical protein